MASDMEIEKGVEQRRGKRRTNSGKKKPERKVKYRQTHNRTTLTRTRTVKIILCRNQGT